MPALRTALIAFIFIALPCSAIARQSIPSIKIPRFKREIPVQVFEGQDAIVGVRGDAALECYRGMRLSEVYYFSSAITLRYRENGLAVSDENGDVSIGLTEVRCKPRFETSAITFGGRAYRGYFKGVFEYSSNNLLIVNMVDIEDYLKGVLPGEIGDRADSEYQAVKAQAVAARTYAVWKLTDQESSGRLSPTIADQLYTGIDAELPLLDRAIGETAGEILIYKDRPIAAYYHAVCGGRTSSIEKVWPEKNHIPYLGGVDDDSNCAWARSFSWSEVFTDSILRDNLDKYFVGRGVAHSGDFDHIIDINFIPDSESRRVETMEIITSAGVFRETVDRIRWALGRPSTPGSILPSTNFSALKQVENGRLISMKLDGTGNGHGVGMCQCGAIGQARKGRQYDSILKYYYRHVKLARLY